MNASNVLDPRLSIVSISCSCGLIRPRLLTDDDQIRSKGRAPGGGRPASQN